MNAQRATEIVPELSDLWGQLKSRTDMEIYQEENYQGRNSSLASALVARRMESSPIGLVVNSYNQQWNLWTSVQVEQSSMTVVDVTRVIRTRMEIDYSVNEESVEYEWAEKSIALASMTVENIKVKEYINGIDGNQNEGGGGNGNSYNGYAFTPPVYFSQYELSSEKKTGFQFVKFWFSSPLRLDQANKYSRSSTTIVVEYDIVESVAGCRAVANESVTYEYKYDFDHCLEKETGISCSICREGFSAPWANDWKMTRGGIDFHVPVFNVTYRFGFETIVDIIDNSSMGSNSDLNSYNNTAGIKEVGRWIQDVYGPPELECAESHVQCSQSACDVSSSSSSATITFSRLDTTSKLCPERPTFHWSIQGDNHDVHDEIDNRDMQYDRSSLQNFISHCKHIDCPIYIDIGGDSSLTKIVSGAILALPALGIVILMVTGYKVHRNRSRMGEGTMGRQDLSPDEERREKARMFRHLPKVGFGTEDSLVVSIIRKYHRVHLVDSNDETSKTEQGMMGDRASTTEEMDKYQQQLVAYSACTSCSICISDFKTREKVRALPKCGHIFHDRCIRKWLVEKNATFCPLCHSHVFMGQNCYSM